MSSQRVSAQGPSNNGLARTDPYAAHTTQCTGSLREIALWLLLAAFLLMLLSDAAYAAERGTPGLTYSAEVGVPTYKIETVCRKAASVRLLDTGAPDNAESCIEDERHAREQLVKEWSQFDMADRIMCNGAARAGPVEPAYTELMTCLEMTRDNHSREASAHVAPRPDQAQLPDSVAAARAQRPGPIRDAFARR
jgi:hypothetical protein